MSPLLCFCFICIYSRKRDSIRQYFLVIAFACYIFVVSLR